MSALFLALCQYVAHRLCLVACCAHFPFLVSIYVSPLLPNHVSSVYCPVKELLYKWSDHLFPSAFPYGVVGFYFACYPFYGCVGESYVLLSGVPWFGLFLF